MYERSQKVGSIVIAAGADVSDQAAVTVAQIVAPGIGEVLALDGEFGLVVALARRIEMGQDDFCGVDGELEFPALYQHRMSFLSPLMRMPL